MVNSITNRQMVFILILTLSTYSLLDISRALAASAGTGSWITLIIAAVIFALAAFIIAALNKRFIGKTLFEYSKEVVGLPGGYLLSVYYILYFLFFVVFIIFTMSKLLKSDFFPKSPPWATMLLGIAAFCYIAYKGITTIARICEIFGIVFIIVLIIIHILMITQGNIDRIRPIFIPSKIGNYFEALKQTVIFFLGIEILLIIPFTDKNKKKGVKTAFLTLIAIGAFYILVVESCIMKLGINDIVNYKDSVIVALRDISLPLFNFFERMDMLYITFGFIGAYIGIIIFIMAIVEYLCRMLPKANRLSIVIIVGAIIYILFLIVSGIIGYSDFAIEIIIYSGLAACLVIPGILLLMSKVKKYGT